MVSMRLGSRDEADWLATTRARIRYGAQATMASAGESNLLLRSRGLGLLDCALSHCGGRSWERGAKMAAEIRVQAMLCDWG